MLGLSNQRSDEKCKVHHAGPEGKELYYYFNLVLGEGGWSTPRPDRFTPGKDPVLIV
jgi:hypothetical protein